MKSISLTPVGPDDVPVLASIGRKTFEQTFAAKNNPEDFADYLEHAFSHEQLASEIANPESAFFVAKVDGRVSGYLKVNRGGAQTETVEGTTLEIERIYVDADLQGAGVGKALFQHALKEAEAMDADAVWLGVWEDNPKAIEFYKRQGFAPFGEHRFVIGNDVQRDILMRFDL